MPWISLDGGNTWNQADNIMISHEGDVNVVYTHTKHAVHIDIETNDADADAENIGTRMSLIEDIIRDVAGENL